MAEKYVSGEEYKALKTADQQGTRKVTLQVNYLMTAGLVIVLCALSFYGGVTYQKHHTKSVTSTAISTRSSGGFGGGFASSGHRSGGIGQVTSVSSTSITIANARTSASSTYTINSSTVISDSGQTVGVSDIQAGDTVFISATTAAPTVATRILVNPSFGGGGGGFGGSGSGSGSASTN